MNAADDEITKDHASTLKRRTRGRGLRTRTGCQACRQRRVKCDEFHPVCSSCRKRGRRCEYIHGTIRSDHESATLASTNALPPEHRRTEGEGDSATQGVTPVDETSNEELIAGASLEEPLTRFDNAHLFNPYGTSPESAISWNTTLICSPDDAPLLWLGLLAKDANPDLLCPKVVPTAAPTPGFTQASEPTQALPVSTASYPLNAGNGISVPGLHYEHPVQLSHGELVLYHHFVRHLSHWIDITDQDRSFGTIVAHIALGDFGLMRAILALSARQISLRPPEISTEERIELAAMDCVNLSVKYYHDTLQYLQAAMQNTAYLRSDELLATVLIVSLFEMLDGSGRDWEKHLKGVFWIQRSQLIHGESEGLRRCIWWAWLKQDIWAAFKNRRRILSFYQLTRPCSSLGFWELVNRAVFLLGQCVNYASDRDVELGKIDLQDRLNAGKELWDGLDEWSTCFAPHDRRLPTLPTQDGFPWEPIWIQPPAAALAVQVHHFACLLLLELMPTTSGLREISTRKIDVDQSVAVICGIASQVTESAAAIMSIKCLYAAREHADDKTKIEAINELLKSHQKLTGWPVQDVCLNPKETSS